MAGHSKFKNIMHRKGAQDAKRGKIFTKIGREIIVAAKLGGGDVDANPRLRAALKAARAANMPKDKIDFAIKKGTGEIESENYEEIRYEGFGPGGIALIVEVMTDNRNRAVSEVRTAFSKHGGNLGESGSVNFMFDHVGLVEYPAAVAEADAMFEAALEAGAENCESDDETHEITCAVDELNVVRDALEAKFGEAEKAKLSWKPKDPTNVDEEQAQSLMKLIDVLDDNDDVQEVYGNYAIADDILEKLAS
jgi:YebC/PmpR family DNA-binding regulatory protein